MRISASGLSRFDLERESLAPLPVERQIGRMVTSSRGANESMVLEVLSNLVLFVNAVEAVI